MKLIKDVDRNGDNLYISPKYVTDIKVIQSTYNQDWCIDICVVGWNKPHTILCQSKNECDSRLQDILESMESVQ